jgi:hypothetical protein
LQLSGLPIAVDNGCYTGLDRRRWLLLIRSLRGQSVLWVAVPDVLGDARATRARFRLWAPAMQYLGLTLAYVAQDGETVAHVPWSDLRCLFIGGSDAWKESEAVGELVIEAKRRGMLVHVGRVNTQRRERFFLEQGVDSFDGSKYSRWPDAWIPGALARLARDHDRRCGCAVPGGDRCGESARGVAWRGGVDRECAGADRA